VVTGRAGYIGIHTAKRLLKVGYHVVVLDNLGTGHQWTIERLRRLARRGPFQFVFVQGDVANTALVMRLVHEYDKGISFFNALVAAGVRHIVFSSTAAVYGIPERVPIAEDSPTHPVNPYGASKRMLEEALRWLGEAHPFRSISLRYFNAAGADHSRLHPHLRFGRGPCGGPGSAAGRTPHRLLEREYRRGVQRAAGD